ncbi:hypothetical protein FSP39_018931 [Pinctada imbricata]|uniref:UDP-glucuronosyltransferase n=1 Tax=Pinctada imbricata TaxID=66713 RepID=A0AA89BZR1_PINIB|nr:hypothetical protein FSP39_018931 [Pinctada imbricata]
MQILWTITILSLYLKDQRVDAARILGVPMPHVAHAYPLIQVDKALRLGYNHSIKFVLPEYVSKHVMLKNEKFDFIISKKMGEANFPVSLGRIVNETMKGKVPFMTLVQMFGRMCESVLSDEDLFRKLKKEKFDMVIVMTAYATDCMNLIGYKLSLPVIQYGPFYEPVLNGIPFNPSMTPDYPLGWYGEDMTFYQRIKNTVLYYGKPFLYWYIYREDVSTKYVPEKPYISVGDLRKHVQFSLFDFDVLLDYPRPLMPHGAFVGGLNTSPTRKLDAEFQTIMDSAKDGVVVVAFGSVFQSFPQEKLDKMFAAMKKVKELTFVMRIGNKSTRDGNIIKRPWIPQNDLLGHKNTKAFITHCGNSAQYEALYHGVPMIGVPFSSDQPHNAERMRNKGYGLVMPLRALETDPFVKVIKEVVYSPVYKNNIFKASQIFKSRPGGAPSARAAYWIDHVIQYGGSYMQPRGLMLPWYIYFGLDVMGVFIVSVVTLVILLMFLVRLIVKKCSKSKKLKTS